MIMELEFTVDNQLFVAYRESSICPTWGAGNPKLPKLPSFAIGRHKILPRSQRNFRKETETEMAAIFTLVMVNPCAATAASGQTEESVEAKLPRRAKLGEWKETSMILFL